MQSKLQIFLLILIGIGITLLFTQKIWVPKLVARILLLETPIANSNTKHFTELNNTFTFEYNSSFSAQEGGKAPTLDWKLNAKEKGTLLATVIIPKTYMQNTNFSDARFTVGRGTSMNSINSCLTPNPEVGDNDRGSFTISGYPFRKFALSDAGAGNFYETTSYRGIVDGDCYVIEYTIHSTNIGNYSPDQGITEFDKSKVQSELSNIIESFRFLINSD